MNTQLFVLVVATFFFVSYMISMYARLRWANTGKLEYIVASRQLGWKTMAFSIAASWIWAVSLFVAAQKSYELGWVGWVWFSIPNIMALVLFGLLASIARKKHPDGYTLPGVFASVHSTRTRHTFSAVTLTVNVIAIAVQLLGAAAIMRMMVGWPFWVVCSVVLFATMGYVFLGGLRSSVYTDVLQQIVIVCGVSALAYACVSRGGWDAVKAGMYGEGASYRSLLDSRMLFSFGIPTALGLLVGPFSDQMYWQRTFAMNEKTIRKSFLLAAVLFSTVPIGMGMIGFLARGLNLSVPTAQLANAATITHLFPVYGLAFLLYVLLSGLCSTIDSAMSSASSVIMNDIANTDRVSVGRAGVVVAGIVALGIALIPDVEIWHIWLLVATFRAGAVVPIVATVLCPARVREPGVFYGFWIAVAIGVPCTFIAQMWGNPNYSTLASVAVIIVSGASTFYWPRARA